MKALIVSLLLLLSLSFPNFAIATNQSPWTDSMGRNFNLTTCEDADNKILKLGVRKYEIERILELKDTPEMHEMLDPKVALLSEWIIIVHQWEVDNCAET